LVQDIETLDTFEAAITPLPLEIAQVYPEAGCVATETAYDAPQDTPVVKTKEFDPAGIESDCPPL
jgi:hypothetical protein